jgi:exopolyphosphatase/guanosine-5'-triphosphate,3'-diphosphate pyrophosphatase
VTATRVAVVDVGSNTARLLVAERGRGGPVPTATAKAYLRLGAEILEHGRVRGAKLAETANMLRGFADVARAAGASTTDVILTAPGRQAGNAEELLAAVTHATGHVARVLAAEEEGVLAFEGAVAGAGLGDEPVAVCDLGGGSIEVAVGDGSRGATWSRSTDLGSLRLTAALLHDDPPTRKQVAKARALAVELLTALDPPRVSTAFAVGGSARALARLVGEPLTVERLDAALELTTSRSSDELGLRGDINPARARTLPAGALILREAASLLGAPFGLGRGGVREGVAARLLA